MLQVDFSNEKFFEYAFWLFSETGHIYDAAPEYVNHSAENFAYLDNGDDIFPTQSHIENLELFSNISRLFTTGGGIVFFSAVLEVNRRIRSQTACEVHELIQDIVNAVATICLFKHSDEIIISFATRKNHCILSDWYSPYDKKIGERLHVANVSVKNDAEYFFDLVYNLARSYYFRDSEISNAQKYDEDFIPYDKTPREILRREPDFDLDILLADDD